MKFFLPVVLLAFLWQIMPVESLVAGDEPKIGEHEVRSPADSADSVVGLFAPEGVSHLPFVATHTVATPAPAASRDATFDEAAQPFLARAAGVVSGLPPPTA